MIYFDNNSTTMMTDQAKKMMIEWCNVGNPSSEHAAAISARNLMDEFRKYIASVCKINRTHNDQYKILFTSGASESNCTILHGVIDSYEFITGKIPHIITSSIEHKSILNLLEMYSLRGRCTVTYIEPHPSGHIDPKDIQIALKSNTCLICVMHANNETGAINDIINIGLIAHKNNIPFHCDTAQTFGKFPPSPHMYNIDSFTISFHKLYGPPGVGALVIKQQLLSGYKICPIIFGTQNYGYRGGTENLPGIAASFSAMRYAMTDRAGKNNNMKYIKCWIIKEISARIPTRYYTAYMQNKSVNLPEIEIVFLSECSDIYLPNTILLSIVKRTEPPICNKEIKQKLERLGIIVSVGSACNTSSPNASHVLYAMHADELIRKGALRISLCDNNTITEAKKMIQELLLIIKFNKNNPN